MFLSYSLVERLLGVQNLLLLNVSFYTLTIGLTILVSYLSFRYLERYFLRWKDRFVIFPSGKPLKNG
jgi:peptidoglycan/LPS O-acetylase OafA/YrhL